MQSALKDIVEIVEGTTKLLVPKDAMNEECPPKEPAFFNPKAKLNRDFSIIAYSAFLKNFDGPKIFLDGLSGLGTRGLRVANEIKDIQKVVINDLNPSALELATKSTSLNNLKKIEISENDVCRFLSSYSRKGNRGTVVDIDPFGSPSKYIDCAIRATMHGGIFSTTATDLQVLHGLFQPACKRRYYGTPIKTKYGNEIAIRLILGCMSLVVSRFDIQIIPLFVENDLHYYRIYVQVLNRPEQNDMIGFIFHCKTCGNRNSIKNKKESCEICNSELEYAGPLWIGPIFDKKFIESMLEEISKFTVDKKCKKILEKCVLESEAPPTYFTLDEIASKMKSAPLSLDNAITKLKKSGFFASPTSLDSTGFKTLARIDKIIEIFSN